jgi:pimeloyl-ACP methyl ester carboxylesterase
VLFLGGFKSDMTGTKALYLQEECAARGQAFLRFDYSGHGQSKGRFEEGTIGGWTSQAQEMLGLLPKGGVIVVGSSMGGWIALNLLLRVPARIAGVIGIAAAPDFTQSIEPRMTPAQHAEMAAHGFIAVPSAYGAEPYIYTKALIEDGRAHVLLDRVHPIDVPLLLLQGRKDDAVPWQTAEAIRAAFPGPLTEITYREEGDHRLSGPEDLACLGEALRQLSV